jgi:predicted HicB family RNase H-like nuclease
MRYRGYEAVARFDGDAGIFHGEVINIRDMITFQGASVEDMKKAFEESVEDYIAFCGDRGEHPDRPLSRNML